jgi:hypothetical protein
MELLLVGLIIGMHWSWLFGLANRAINHLAKPGRWKLRRGKQREYEIGGKVYYPTPLNKATMRKLIDAQAETSVQRQQQMGPLGFLLHVGQEAPDPGTVKAETIASIDAMYDQLAVLLLDKDTGEHADSDHLGTYLTLPEARQLTDELMAPVAAYNEGS